MKKRFISLVTALCVVVCALSSFPSFVLHAMAEENVYGYGANVLQNPAPTSNDFWERTGCSYGKFLDMGNGEPYIIGTKRGGDISVRQQVTLTDADVIRANNGELSVSASGKFYAQGSRTLTANLNIICYDSTGAVKITYSDKHSGYSVTGRTKTLNVGKSRIPAGTAYIVYEGAEHLGSGSAYFGMYDFSMIFYDDIAPAVIGEPYLYAVNQNTALPAYVMPGDTVTYGINFDEAVKVSVEPILDLSTESRANYNITYSADRQTVYFTVKLKNTGTNGALKLKKISGLSVRDDAGNSFDYSAPSLSVGTLAYKSVFNVTSALTNLKFSGAASAPFGSDYSAAITPEGGYKLPENIAVRINGTDTDDFSYNKTNGAIKVNSAAIRGDIKIAASAVPRTYTVTFDMHGGSGGTESAHAAYLQAMPAVTPPSKAGYTFGGYYSEVNGNGVQYYNYDGKAIKKYDKASNLTLYAKWSAKEYTVTLDAAGGTGSGTVTAEYDSDMPPIVKPTKKGYTFLGYFTQQNGGGEKYYNADGASAKRYDKTDGLTLYADWSANTYTVTFDKQGGSGGEESTDAVYDSKMPSVTPPERTGYTFGGYFENTDGGGAQYYYANGEAARSYDVDSACTLYAKWTANTYDIVLNAQGGSGGSAVTAVFDSAMPAITAPDKPGYLFGGYFDGKNGSGTKYYNVDCSSARAYNKAEGVTLYALWTPITYNIQLYSRGESVASLKNVVYGELCLPSAEALGITYPNYNFVGWNIYDEQNWAMYTADRNYAAGLVTEQGKTAYVYAAWLEKDKYTVTYDANGGEGAPPAVEVHADETVGLSKNIPTRQNYTFMGWAEKPDSAAVQYRPGDSFTMGNSLITLFAVWVKNPELVYNANGGVFGTYAGSSYPAAGSSVKLTEATPKKDGYVFCGWAETQTATKADIVSSPYTMPNRDTVLYAVYEPVKYMTSVFAASGYSVSGINAGGYTLGEYAEFTVSGSSPKVYVNGILMHPINGVYKTEIRADTSVVVADNTSINVIYNANSGVNAPIDMRIYANGDMAAVKPDLPVRKGYVFKGWAAEAESDYAQYTGGDSIPVTAEDIVLYAVWGAISYTVRYDTNGGSGVMASETAVYDKEHTLPENTFEKTGCRFAGWSLSAGGELAYTDGAAVINLTDVQNGEIVLYAVWNGARTKINFNFEGGSSGTASCEAVYGKILPSDKLVPPMRYGYKFAGYYTSAGKGGNPVYKSDMTLSDSYLTAPWSSIADEFELYAAWEPVTYTVAFVSGTQTTGSVSAVYGDAFSLPKAETLGVSVPSGYTFCGWSLAPGSDAVYYSDGQEITAGLTGESGAVVYLYAVIRENESYTVTLPASREGCKVYYNNAEVTAPKNITVGKGDDISFTVRVEDGYSADKMTVSANGIMLGAVQINSSNYTYSIKNISSDTSINIYHVKKEAFRIILNDGTGYSVSPQNTVVESGDDFSFTVTLADGYKTSVPVVFANGSTLSGAQNGDVFTYTLSNITSHPVISIAVAKKPQYTVTFVSNGSIYSIAVVEKDMKALQPAAPERSGHTFGGWYTDSACSSPYDFQRGVTADIRLYAKWTADTYAVVYNKNTENEVAVPSGQTKKHDNVLILSPKAPVRAGYTFKGWNTKADGTGTSYSAGSELSVNADITLYAQWEINKFAITLITGEGVTGSLSANEVVYNGTVNVSSVSGAGYNPPVITAVPRENAELVSEGVYRITGSVSFIAAAQPGKIYTASFYIDNGLYYTQSAIEGSPAAVALPNPPGKTGYRFTGWYTERTGGIKVDETTVIDKDLSVYARFEIITPEIVPARSGEGYTVESTDSTTVNYGDDYNFTITIAPHYNAGGMRVYANGILLSGIESGGVYSYSVKNITVNQIITVTGVELDKHTVTYMVDGQVYLTVQSDYNSLLAEPVSPSKQGEAFKGWSDGERVWSFPEDKVTSDMTLYPVWESGMLSVNPAQSGEGYTVESTGGTEVSYGGDYHFTITIAPHYSADGMRVYANGILLVPDITENTYGFTVKNITEDITVTVYGVTADIYTVKYIADGEAYYSEKVVYNNKAQKPKAPSKTGYTFTGWFAGEDEWDFETGIEADLELEAKFEPLAYTVSVPQDRSEFTVNVTSDSRVEHGGSFLFSITLSDGYNASDMEVYANGVLLEKTAEDGNTVHFEVVNITEATVITVRGIGQNTYSVAYNANTTEYVGNMPQSTIKNYDTDVSISELIPERYGYDFVGWSSSADGAASYFGGDMYSENADIKLYAVWETKKFAVSFETNGGVINAGKITEYTYGTGTPLPTDVSKNGYNFAGWYEDELMQGVRVYEIKENDFGEKTYYAAYTMANVTVSGYTGEYDGNAHDISYTLADNLSVEKYQWYFLPSGSEDAVPVSSVVYNTYSVKNAAESGEYYCYIEALLDGYVTRFFTEKATVAIGRKPVSVKAADSSKVYDAKPLSSNETELAGSGGLVDGHKITAVMTAESKITNVGSKANEIERIAVSDSESTDVTDNYEITKQSGTLYVTPLTLTVSAKDVNTAVGSALSENRLYEISGVLGNEELSLKTTSVAVKNADNADVPFADITKTTGTYAVTISYRGFEGEGCENYQGSGTFAATVTVYRQSSGGGGSGGGRATASVYTVNFDSDGSKVESQSVKSGEKAEKPDSPEKDGFTFDGWFSDRALTAEFDFNSKITKSITLYAKWTKIKQNDENPSAADPEKTGVARLLETEKHLSYMNGYGNDTFKPESNMTRAEAAQMFYNLLLDKNVSGESAFDDVSTDAWYCGAVAALANLGIIKGIGGKLFNPDGKITRAEFVAAAMRFVNIDVNGAKTFSDVAKEHWAAQYISDAAALGWISGNDDGAFCPDSFVSRASAAKIVNNMLGRRADIEYANKHNNDIRLFADVSPSAWYYADVIEAANAHGYEKNNGVEVWK